MPTDCSTLLIGSQRPSLGLLDDCETATTITAWSQSLNTTILIVNTCKRWTCRFCGAMKVKELAARCVDAKPNRLITLTVNPALHENPRAAFDTTSPKVATWIQHFRRELGTYECMRVLEITKRGWPHYHMAARCPYLPHADASAVWDSLTGAPIVDVRQIKQTRDVYWYITKYLAKQSYIPWTKRRVSMTRHFALRKPDKRISELDLIGHHRTACHPRSYLAWNYPHTKWTAIGRLIYRYEGRLDDTAAE